MLWLLVISAVSLFLYYKIIKPLSYWKDRGIVYKKPLPLLGNSSVLLLQQKPFFEYVRDVYNQFPNERYVGVHQFTKPALFVRDPDLIKEITVKNFDHFADHNDVIPDDVEPLLSKNLMNLKGQRWRDVRATLSPSFTSSKMKMMFVLVSECAQRVSEYFEKQKEDLLQLEVKNAFSRFTVDVIASVAFGFQCDSLKDPNNEFYRMGMSATNFSKLRSLVFVLYSVFPKLAQLLQVNLFPYAVTSFFYRIVKETIQLREREGLVRPDMIHLLLEARKGKEVHDAHETTVDASFAAVEESKVHHIEKKRVELTNEDITAQALIFFFAGFETTSTTASFLFHELAMNSSAQEKLQKEIDAVLSDCNGKLTYEALHKMKYMDMVVSETIRKWPPGFQTDRVCLRDFTIQPQNSLEKPLTIKKGTVITIPIVGVHYDPQYYPNPYKFDPERFNDENKHNIKASAYIPFGSGPRSCIASRFALMEIKTLTFHLLSKFNVVPIPKTDIPLKLTTGIRFGARKGFWLGLRQRKAV
ncbi:hypothetical protein FQA39_LY00159 [Lamprigera yunnana]|nr:hypothetical protein FQA39_LY00159 [Lamprigera yunnana]